MSTSPDDTARLRELVGQLWQLDDYLHEHTESHVPGGKYVHSIAGRLVRRQMSDSYNRMATVVNGLVQCTEEILRILEEREGREDGPAPATEQPPA